MFHQQSDIAPLQVWFDDPESLRKKVAVAANKQLRGVGVWHLDCLDHASQNPAVQAQTRQMWASLQPFTRRGGLTLQQ